jgi:predicted lipid-binding transport protein (Tim44 family)
MEILIFAAVAAVVLARLYMVLGQNRGAEPPPLQQRPQPVDIFQRDARREATPPPANDASGPDLDAAAASTVRVSQYGAAAPGLEAIGRKDRAFEPEAFLDGARGAYQMIVEAYGRNNVEALRGLLNAETLAAYETAIQERVASGAPRIEVVRLSDARIVGAELVGNRAEIDVHFSADLADGGDGLRPTDEVWSFERDVTSRNPAWLLCGVAAA